MKYIFPDYATGKRILRIGNDTLEVSDGIANIDVLNPVQVTLAEVYGGQPLPVEKPANGGHRPGFTDRARALVEAIGRQKGPLKGMMRALDGQVRTVQYLIHRK